MQIQTTMYNNIISLNKYFYVFLISTCTGIIRRDANRSVCLVIVASVETRVWSSNAKMSLTIEIASLDDVKFLSRWLPIKR